MLSWEGPKLSCLLVKLMWIKDDQRTEVYVISRHLCSFAPLKNQLGNKDSSGSCGSTSLFPAHVVLSYWPRRSGCPSSMALAPQTFFDRNTVPCQLFKALCHILLIQESSQKEGSQKNNPALLEVKQFVGPMYCSAWQWPLIKTATPREFPHGPVWFTSLPHKKQLQPVWLIFTSSTSCFRGCFPSYF